MAQEILAEPGTTLFHIAAKYLGNAEDWSRLANINNIKDPFVLGAATVVIPKLLGTLGIRGAS